MKGDTAQDSDEEQEFTTTEYDVPMVDFLAVQHSTTLWEEVQKSRGVYEAERLSTGWMTDFLYTSKEESSKRI